MGERETVLLLKWCNKILKLLVRQRVEQNPNLSGQAIMEKLRLTRRQYMAVKSYLWDMGYIIGDPAGRPEAPIMATSKGIAFYEQQHAVPAVQIEQVFQGPVYGAAIANAVHSSVQQSVEGVQANDVRQALIGVIEEMVRNVQAELPSEQLAAYTQVARHFQQEVVKDKPDVPWLRHALATLSFLGDLEGTGQLVERLTPYAPIVAQLLSRLLSSL
jgi:hypothetical protein